LVSITFILVERKTILLIEERRERERGEEGEREREGLLFIFKCVREMTLLKKKKRSALQVQS